jgi:hypothetical protein
MDHGKSAARPATAPKAACLGEKYAVGWQYVQQNWAWFAGGGRLTEARLVIPGRRRSEAVGFSKSKPEKLAGLWRSGQSERATQGMEQETKES